MLALYLWRLPDGEGEQYPKFGSVRKVQLPLALPSIMLGSNQAIMMSVGMVIITALIGAGGLGLEVYRAVVRLDTGFGFEVALSIVFLAIIMDRLTEARSVGRQLDLDVR